MSIMLSEGAVAVGTKASLPLKTCFIIEARKTFSTAALLCYNIFYKYIEGNT